MRQVTFYAISDLCTDTGRDNYPVARPDGQTDVLLAATCRDDNRRITRRIFFGTGVTCRF